MGRGQNIDFFRLSWDRPAMRHCRQIGHLALGTGHTNAGGQCADATEAGIDIDGPARIMHTRVWEAGALGGRKAGRGCLRNARLGGQNG